MKVLTAMLADAAIVADGKLYIHGGGWDVITAPPGEPDEPILHNASLVLVFQTDWAEAQQDLTVAITLLDADRQPAGLRGHGSLRTGHSAQAQPGDPAVTSFVADFYPLPIPRAGFYFFCIEDGDGTTLAEVPFRAWRQRS